ncbi:MAG TPA: ABC transporter permease, partial [Candidatus Desulfaltia sp.]|nr:ABC transporter permease [Candidatus Desulfaltia sp.]
NPEGETPVWVLEPCEPQETIILAPETAVRLPTVGVQRVALELSPDADPDALAERLALERGYISYSSTFTSYAVYRLGNFFEGRGLTLAIPWGIVVLNVVVTMLNALYERRKEIEILSSVGLNPAQVSAIFIAEASITGFMAGGLGYLMGLSLYKGMAALNIGLQVHQKVSAVWSMASIGLAISAVLTGAFAALRSSVVITPSLMRRWRIDRGKGGFQDPWTVAIPLKLQPEEVKPYMDYMYEKLGRLQGHPTQITSSIKRFEDGDVRKITFIYKSVQATTGNFYTVNELVVAPHPNGEYGAELKSLGNHDWVHVAGTLIRRLTMDFSTDKVG